MNENIVQLDYKKFTYKHTNPYSYKSFHGDWLLRSVYIDSEITLYPHIFLFPFSFIRKLTERLDVYFLTP